MIEWAHPLWFLALPLAALAPWLARSPRLAVGALALARTRATLRVLLAWVPRALGSLGLVMLVVALARPQHVDRKTIVEHEGIDILLVLDTSGSMEAEDYRLGGRDASRLEVAKEVIATFVEGRPNDRIGLVVFGEEAFTQVPLTTDHDALVAFLRLVRLGMAGQRATAIGDAVAVAGKRLSELDAPSKVVILLTDGRSNAGQVQPLQAAEAARALGVKVYTIGVGSKEGGRGGGLFGMLRGGGNELDEQTLQQIARTTGAEYFRAGDTEALTAVYEKIDQLETSTAEVEELVRREERFQPWAVAGLVLLLLQVLLGETVFRRLP
jgi:Ca-activated chloride channel family protein